MGQPANCAEESQGEGDKAKHPSNRNLSSRGASIFNSSAAKFPTAECKIHGFCGVGKFDDTPHRITAASCALMPQESAGTINQPTTDCGYVRWGQSSSRRAVPAGSPGDRASWFHALDSQAQNPSAADPRQARTISELMQIRAFHSQTLKKVTVGTALGFRMKDGQMTDRPAILAFVSRKVHEQWLLRSQQLPSQLHGPGGIWCDVDVIEFSFDSSAPAGRELAHTELADGLRGGNPKLGPGSQVASEEGCGTLGLLVRSTEGSKALGFLTNHHVAVDFNQPRQLMYHPLPPHRGPGMFLGVVDRASSFTLDLHWYGAYSSRQPDTFVRADGAFVPFQSSFSLDLATTNVQKFGPMGVPRTIHMHEGIGSVVGRRVAKAGRSSGLTYGTIMGYAVEYHDDKTETFLTDFLIVGDSRMPFDMEGDSGSAILMLPAQAETLNTENHDSTANETSISHSSEDPQQQAARTEDSAEGASEDPGENLPRPVGIIWGGTASKWRLKLRNGKQPENWTSGVDLVRLLDLLELEAVTSDEQLREFQKDSLSPAAPS